MTNVGECTEIDKCLCIYQTIDTCAKCDAGRFSSGSTLNNEISVCHKCPRGKFNASIGAISASSCQNCSVGYTALIEGSTFCEACPTGQYCSTASSKFLCPKGKYNNLTMQTSEKSCRNCTIGRIALSEGSKSSVLCPKGAYCPDALTKTLCPVGKYGTIDGAITLSTGCSNNCGIGKFGFTGASRCASCPSGKYGESGQCYDCKPGCLERGVSLFEPRKIITKSARHCRSVFAVDIDNDGDIDLVSASDGDDKMFINISAPAVINVGYRDLFQWQDGSIFSSFCDNSNVYLPLVMHRTEFINVLGYEVEWAENIEPVVAQLKLNESSSMFHLVQNTERSIREAIVVKDICNKAYPNCCMKTPLADKSMLQIYAGIQYTNSKLNITSSVPTTIGTIKNNVLIPCPLRNNWRVRDGAVNCVPIFCPAGQESQGYLCVDCPQDYSKSAAGTHSCSKCDDNSFTDTNGSLACTVCEQGKAMVKNVYGVFYCEACKRGTYQNAKGQPLCTPCPVDTYSETTSNTALAQCIKCTEFASFTTTNNSIGVGDATKGCMCRGKNKEVDADVGYYRNKDKKIVNGHELCLVCPEGALCKHPNTTILTLETQSGFFRENASDNIFYKCHNLDDCKGGIIETGPNDQCVKGNAGILCALCADDYVRIDGICKKCEGSGSNSIGMPLMIIVFGFVYIIGLIIILKRVKFKRKEIKKVNRAVVNALVLGAVAKLKLRAKKNEKEKALQVEGGKIPGSKEGDRESADKDIQARRSSISKFSGRAKILLGFMQINAALNLSVDVPWPSAFLSFINFSKIMNVDFMAIASPFSPCSFQSNYLEIFYMHMSILPLVLCFTVVAFYIAKLRNSPDEKNQCYERKNTSNTKFRCLFIISRDWHSNFSIGKM